MRVEAQPITDCQVAAGKSSIHPSADLAVIRGYR